MKRWTFFLVAVAALAATAPSYAQEGVTPGTVELTIVPGGSVFFAGGSTESRFRNYTVGGSLAFNVNDVIGFEAEGNAALGIHHQLLAVSGTTMTEAPPNLFDVSGNMTFAPVRTRHVIPYGVVGLGSMVLLTHTDLGIGASKVFLTGNAGGGLKWYANARWGLRADYRFVTVQSTDRAPEFFGREGRIAHRIYGGVVLNLVP